MGSSTVPAKADTSPASSSKTDTNAPASKEHRRKKAKKKNAVVLAKSQPQSSALAKLPQAAQLTTERPTIQALINNVEEVRKFVARHLNVELAKFMSKAKPTDEKALEKWERKRQDLEIDWGTIPGVGKPFLKQPGAEKFCLWLQLRPKYYNREIDLSNGHMKINSKVILFSKKTSEEVFEGPECSCSTMESNYRYRMAQSANKPDKAEADRLKSMGLGRWKKVAEWKGGKKVGDSWVWFERVENPNIYDEQNKVGQIGQKRALVKCVRGAGAMSEIFTSDPNEWDDVRSDDDVDSDPYTDMDFTASGRRIVEQDGHSPSGKPVTHEAKKAEGRAAAQAVADEKTGKKPDSLPGAESEERDPFNGIVEIDQTNEADPVVRGDIATILPVMQKNFRMTWKGDDHAWHIDGRDVENLFEMCRQLSYHYWHFLRDNEKKIIKFADGKRIKESTDAPAATETPKGTPVDSQPVSAPQATTTPLKPGESLVTGIVKDYFDKTTTATQDTKDGRGNVIKRGRPSVPYLNVLFTDSKKKATFLNAFDHKHFQPIAKARQSQAECVFIVKTGGSGHVNIIGIVRVGTQEFHDGLPVIPLNREAGSGTGELFK